MNNKYLSVSEINHYLKEKFENDLTLQSIFLKGEISNYKDHTTGHLYFTLKDETSRISAVMFRFNAAKLTFKPTDGTKVLVIGKITVYEPGGNYSIVIDEMIPDGIGNLYLEYEKLKKKLEQKGYFRQDRKKTIPKFPKKIGIITATTGAAIRDIITTINRRYSLAELYIFPTLVQGIESSKSICESLNKANNYPLDVIILGRGGGSIEDLWSFNEETVAESIIQSKIPIISAVGHEIDFTISDFVSDLRAPTPTAAAELVAPNLIDIKNYLNNLEIRGSKSILNELNTFKNKLTSINNSYILKNPNNIYEPKIQKLDNLIDRLLLNTKSLLNESSNKLLMLDEKITSNIKKTYQYKENKFLNQLNRIEVLNPILTIKRGYAVIYKEDNVIPSIKNIKKDDNLKIKLKDGNIITKVERIEENGK